MLQIEVPGKCFNFYKMILIFKNHHSTEVGQHHSFLLDRQCVRHWHCWCLSCSHHTHVESNIPQCLYDLKKKKIITDWTHSHIYLISQIIKKKMVNKSTVVLIYKMYLQQNLPFCTASASGVTPYLFEKSLLQPASHSIYRQNTGICKINYKFIDQCNLIPVTTILRALIIIMMYTRFHSGQ